MDTGSRLPLGKVGVGQSQESTQDPAHTFLIIKFGFSRFPSQFLPLQILFVIHGLGGLDLIRSVLCSSLKCGNFSGVVALTQGGPTL